ncbi:MAG TPA: tRNA(His) guanylyltransferase Thg1 family protein [Dictyobacter sp.]|jgi:tRNA(His) 5'-end guanylyltransferase|nr:tRNA(His) guanylyltransferase Thg1 family protein [Dictyobacter sp.]
MDSNEFDKRMRQSEYFHALRCLPGAWVVLRLDGRGFTKFTERESFEKPFDGHFQALMRETTQALLQELQGIYAYTESDEISLVFRQDWDLFDREVEKIVSLSASIASATFSLAYQQSKAYFDSRIWLGTDKAQVVDYFRWRQEDAVRCALNGWCHWTLRKEGKSPAEAMAILHGQTLAFKKDLLVQRGLSFDETPLWQRRGTGIYFETYEKSGYDPIIGQEVTATRRRVTIDEALPMKESYGTFIQHILDANSFV